MRQDMNKVLTEPARRERGLARADHGVDPLDIPPRGSLRARWHGQRKERNTTVRPIRRFLRSRVGRDWNEVFSEICRVNSLDSFTQLELRRAVECEVERRVQVVSGRPRTADGFGLLPGELWVHPDSGILMRVPDEPRRRFKPRRKFPQVVLDDSYRFVQVEGIWYLVGFKLAPAVKGESAYDVVLKCQVHGGSQQSRRAQCRIWGEPVYAACKRQLGKRDIRRLERFKERELGD